MGRYQELDQKRKRDKAIIEKEKKSYLKGEKSFVTEEEYLSACEQNGQKEINELYTTRIVPTDNALWFFIYWIVTLIALPLSVCFQEGGVYIAYFAILALIVVGKFVEKIFQKNMEYENPFLVKLNNFSNDCSVFMYLATSLGFMTSLAEKYAFWIIYIIIAVSSLICFYFDVIKSK